MSLNQWQRLHTIVMDRISNLGETRDQIHAKGGPTSETIRGLKDRQGRVTVKQVKSLLALDAALGWDAGTSRSLVDDDRSDWSEECLETEARELAERNLPNPIVAPGAIPLSKEERDIRGMQTSVGAALRRMEPAQRRDAMEQIARLLGIPF